MLPYDPAEIIEVSHLLKYARNSVEKTFSLVYVQGEISNLSRPSSGHLYFSLKDHSAQIRCVLFQQRLLSCAPGIAQQLDNGSTVLIQAMLTIYEERGDLQLLVQQLALVGEGSLQQQYEALKRRLQQEGLFHRKKHKIPLYPTHIGIITSPTGAALQDVLAVLGRRYPLAKILLYPSSVQGEQAPAQLIQALKQAYTEACVDVLLLVRGGGSLEDLWAFNTESVVRMVADSPLPLISGVGHEVDTTLVDFVSSQRAPTPSVAAEMATPYTQEQLKQQVTSLKKSLYQYTQYALERWMQQLDRLQKRLLSPKDHVQQQQDKVQSLQERLEKNIQRFIQKKEQLLLFLQKNLQVLSPLTTLERGYCIVRTPQGLVVNGILEAREAASLSLMMKDGELTVIPVKEDLDSIS